MRKRIGCLHAHHSNIAYIEKALSSYGVELLHFVDPALVYRISSDKSFGLSDARRKVNEQLEWVAKAGVDTILITCTNYVALLQEDQLNVSVPIIKIDEPLFTQICNQEQPQILLFTNSATVEGTMKRLNEHAQAMGKQPEVEVLVIEGAFELIMQGEKEQYVRVLSAFICNLLETDNDKPISVAQLSMVEAARLVSAETGIPIGNPLETIVSAIFTER